jgi:biopolymer transport protein ExbB/TolQ
MDNDLMNSLLQKWVIDGGPVMFLLVPCSLLMVGALLQGMIRLRIGRVVPNDIARHAASASANAATRANFLRALRGDPRPLALVVRRALQGHEDLHETPDPRALEVQLEAAAVEVADEMSEGLGLLSTLYTVAPLIGLLGTVLGLMTTFGVFATGAQRSLEEMSKGVKQHMVATVWGLCIAIAAYIAAYYLQRRIIQFERRALPDAGFDIINQLFAGPLTQAPVAASASTGPAMETADGKPIMSTTLLMDTEKIKASLVAAHTPLDDGDQA